MSLVSSIGFKLKSKVSHLLLHCFGYKQIAPRMNRIHTSRCSSSRRFLDSSRARKSGMVYSHKQIFSSHVNTSVDVRNFQNLLDFSYCTNIIEELQRYIYVWHLGYSRTDGVEKTVSLKMDFDSAIIDLMNRLLTVSPKPGLISPSFVNVLSTPATHIWSSSCLVRLYQRRCI